MTRRDLQLAGILVLVTSPRKCVKKAGKKDLTQHKLSSHEDCVAPERMTDSCQVALLAFVIPANHQSTAPTRLDWLPVGLVHKDSTWCYLRKIQGSFSHSLTGMNTIIFIIFWLSTEQSNRYSGTF